MATPRNDHTDHNEQPPRASRPRGAWSGPARRWALGGLVAATAVLSAAVWAHDGAGARGGQGAAHGHHAAMHGPAGFGPWMFFGSPERVERGVDRLLDGLAATDAQRTQIKQIATAAAADLKTQREAGRVLHERSAQVFTAPVIDANAAEQLRQQMLAQHDQVSRRTLQAVLDVSQVLTPEQRAKLGERMAEHRGRFGKARMGWDQRPDAQPAKVAQPMT